MSGLSIETFAEARARLDAGQEPAAVFTTLALGESEWRAESERLLGELADEVDRGELGRIRALQATYRDTWAAITGAPPRAGDDVPREAPTTDASPQTVEAPPPPVALSKASYQIAAERPAAQAAPPPPLVGSATGVVNLSEIVASLPFRGAGSPPTPPPAPPPAARRVDTGTKEITADELKRIAENLRGGGGATVFSAEAAVPRPAAQAVPFAGAKPTPAPLGATMFSPASAAPRAPVAAVPFREGPSATPPPAAQAPKAGNVSADELRDVIARMGGASSGTMFSADAAAPRAPAAATPFRREEEPGSLRSNHGNHGQPTARRPEDAAPAAGAARIPLEEYARIAALLTKEGNPPATLARLGVKPDHWMSNVRAYAAQFVSDPALQRRFDQLVQQNLQALR